MKRSLLLLFLIPQALISFSQTDIHLDQNTTFQTWKAWESMGWIGQWGNPWLFANLQNWQDTMINGAAQVGVTRARVEVYSGVENPVDYFSQFAAGGIDESQFEQYFYQIVNDNDDPNSINPAGFQFSKLDYDITHVIVPLKTAVENLGNPFYFNLCYVDFGASQFEHYQQPEEYAEFMLMTFQHLQQTFGFVPDGLEIILEPDNNGTWPTDGTTIAAVIKAAATRLAAAGFHPEIIIPSTLDTWNAYEIGNHILQDTAAAAFVKEIAYHKYSGAIQSNFELVCQLAQAHGLTSSMLEYWENGNDQYGLFQDLTQACVGVWQHGIIGDDYVNATSNAFFRVEHGAGDAPVFLENNHTRYFRQYFRHILPGSVRIGTTISDQAHQVTAWTLSGKTSVVVNARHADMFLLHDLPQGIYSVRFSTSADNYQFLPDINVVNEGDIAEISMPAEGVFTVFRHEIQVSSTDFSIDPVAVFPNPFSDHFSIKNIPENTCFEMTNALGQLVYKGTNIGEPDFSGLPPGIYFLKIATQKCIKIMKL